MLTNLVFFVMLISGSVYGAARFERRFEQTMPLCVMGAVLILFGFGLLGALETGMMALYVLTIGLYLLTVVSIFQKKEIVGHIKYLLTPGFVFFLISYVLLAHWNNGKLAADWDEFSHWADTVKAATYVGDFGTNPAAGAAFPSYPPAMMLFQYSLQKVHLLLNPGAAFSEWRVFFAFQIFFVAVNLPFLKDVTFRQPLKLGLYAVIIILGPMLFFQKIYKIVLIDPILGILFGSGMAMVLLETQPDKWEKAYVYMVCTILTLTKDVGFPLALALALAYGAVQLLDTMQPMKNRLISSVAALAAAWIPKILWSWEVKQSDSVVVFGGKIDWNILWTVITGKDITYRSELVSMYWDALFTKEIVFGQIPISLNYIQLMAFFFVVLFILWWLLKKEQPSKWKQYSITLGIAAAILPIYAVGLCVIYLFKYTEYEAMLLASMQRYLNIAFLGVWMLILLLLAYWISRRPRKWIASVLMLILLIGTAMAAPYSKFIAFIRGDYIEDAIEERAPFEEMKEEIHRVCDGDDKIWFISQGNGGWHYWVTRFNARPNSFNAAYTWHIGKPRHDKDINMRMISPEQWRQELLEEYDYVALYAVNDFFVEYYGSLFAEPDAIEVNALYRINQQTGLLELCK